MIANAFVGQVAWSSVSQFEVMEGIIAVGLVLLFATVIGSSRLGSLFDSSVLRNHVRSPLSYVFTFLAILGALSFVLLGMCGMQRVCNFVDVNGWNVAQYPLNFLGYLGGSALGPGGRMGYGLLALLTWGGTVVLLSLGVGFTRAVKFFALPSLLFLTVVVFLFDPGDMDSHALNLASGFSFDGVSLLSNWFLLTVSLFFTVYGLMRGRLGAPRRALAARARHFRGIRRSRQS